MTAYLVIVAPGKKWNILKNKMNSHFWKLMLEARKIDESEDLKHFDEDQTETGHLQNSRSWGGFLCSSQYLPKELQGRRTGDTVMSSQDSLMGRKD